MLNTATTAIIVSSALGILAGLGVGGGSLLILWLTVVLSMDPVTAKSINLLFFIPAALVSFLINWKKRRIVISEIFPAVLLGCLSAAVIFLAAQNISAALLKKGYGILLLIIGVRELFYRPRKAK